MIDIIGRNEEITCFVNEIWVAVNNCGEADRVFLHKPQQQDINCHLITISSKNELPEQNLYKFIQAGMTFNEVNASENFNLLEKSRLFRIKASLTEFIAANNHKYD